MFTRFQAIVLHSIPYTDNKRIVHCFTREEGRKSFMLYLKTGPKAKGRLSLIQPFSIIEIEAKGSPGQNLHTLKDAKPMHHFTSISFDPVKQMQVLFMSELCYSVLQNETDNSVLYHFIEYSILFLDEAKTGNWLHVKFMMELCTYLGFKLSVNAAVEQGFFNPFTGCIQGAASSETCNERITQCIKTVASSTNVELEEMRMSNALVPDVINVLVIYYKHHIAGFKDLKTLDYFRRV